MENLKYPIGRLVIPETVNSDLIRQGIEDIASFPERLRRTVHNLSDEQLNTPYRPEGWTIRQVVHHCADSHMNSIIRFKLALTEDTPTIRPYYEDRWAELADSKTLDIEPSLRLLDGVHKRLDILLNSLVEDDMEKSFIHPEYNRSYTLAQNILNYGWHCNHHLAHITCLKEKMGWK